ncbi:hypothetical protein [Streptomyces sp. SAI-135]|uniref:hypothetical protein n=1 Tax=Streptomyces sp. SAI-135 TaxID=2940549 RepID=UPI0032B01542
MQQQFVACEPGVLLCLADLVGAERVAAQLQQPFVVFRRKAEQIADGADGNRLGDLLGEVEFADPDLRPDQVVRSLLEAVGDQRANAGRERLEEIGPQGFVPWVVGECEYLGRPPDRRRPSVARAACFQERS